jgi:uncharacterized protein (TIGR03437 family)
VNIGIPGDAAGSTRFGRWYVLDSGAAGGVAVSPAFRMTIFGTDHPPHEISILSSVSAASLVLGLVAPESIVSGFGASLATATATATSVPLPTALAGITVSVRDSTGSERLAPLLYASPRQINYQIPAGTAPGEAAVSLLRDGTVVAAGKAQVAPVSPALFAANASGMGVASALALRVKADGAQKYETVARFDTAEEMFIAEPIDLGPEGDQVFLILFGTGFRFASGSTGITATVGGSPAEVLFAGPQGQFAGLDQLNARLDRRLRGRGVVDVAVTVDGHSSNILQVSVQ